MRKSIFAILFFLLMAVSLYAADVKISALPDGSTYLTTQSMIPTDVAVGASPNWVTSRVTAGQILGLWGYVLSSDYANLITAHSAAVTAGKTLLINGTTSLTADLVMTAPVEFSYGKGLITLGGHKLTTASCPLAGNYQIVSGSGTFLPIGCAEYPVEWRGVKPITIDNTTDYSTLINTVAYESWASSKVYDGHRVSMKWSSSYHILNPVILGGNYLNIVGSGNTSSGLVSGDPLQDVLQIDNSWDASQQAGWITGQNFALMHTAPTSSTADAIRALMDAMTGTGVGLKVNGPGGNIKFDNVDTPFNPGGGIKFSNGVWNFEITGRNEYNGYDGINSLSTTDGQGNGNALKVHGTIFQNKGCGIRWSAAKLDNDATIEGNWQGQVCLDVSTNYSGGANIGGYLEEEYKIGRFYSGSLKTGKTYTIITYVAGDNFTNVGDASPEITGNVFTATGTTPTNWTHGSTLQEHTDAPAAIQVAIDSGKIFSGLNVQAAMATGPGAYPSMNMVKFSGSGTMKGFQFNPSVLRLYYYGITIINGGNILDNTSWIWSTPIVNPASANVVQKIDTTISPTYTSNDTIPSSYAAWNLANATAFNSDVTNVYDVWPRYAGEMKYDVYGAAPFMIPYTAEPYLLYAGAVSGNQTLNLATTNISWGPGYNAWQPSDMVQVLLNADASGNIYYWQGIVGTGSTTTNIVVTALAASHTGTAANGAQILFSRWTRLATNHDMTDAIPVVSTDSSGNINAWFSYGGLDQTVTAAWTSCNIVLNPPSTYQFDYCLTITQDSGGSKCTGLTWYGGSATTIKWLGNTSGPLSTGSGAVDKVCCRRRSGTTIQDCDLKKNYQ